MRSSFSHSAALALAWFRLVMMGLICALVWPAHAAELSFPRGLDPGPMTRAQAQARAGALTDLGRALFFDPTLSASGMMSCATCHVPARAYGPDEASAVHKGGPNNDQPGLRAVPSLRYRQVIPAFTEHYFESEDEGDESIDNGPTGGLTWDGRVDRGRDQARIPLLSPFEMANTSQADVVAKAKRAPYAEAIRQIFGVAIFDHDDQAFDAVAQALEVFEQSATDFYPYSSRYDAHLQGQSQLTAQELRGLDLFMAEDKGNCDSCHAGGLARDGSPPQFSDFGFVALGVPRNPDIPANADPNYFDLGLCGPQRTDLRQHDDYCGLFRVPTLRNIALRQSFFHNGVMHKLRDAVAFYATRDTDPGRWYPRKPDGSVATYNDLPPSFAANINTDAPFGGKPGEAPRLNDQEIDDIVAFLKTLTDADLISGP